MKTIELAFGNTKHRIIVYRAGESVTVFKGATGQFGAVRGSKTAGIVVVQESPGSGIRATEYDIDDVGVWDWIQTMMQKGMQS